MMTTTHYSALRSRYFRRLAALILETQGYLTMQNARDCWQSASLSARRPIPNHLAKHHRTHNRIH